ncbi:MAG: tryptophan-rich sensory protein [Bacteroidaceae bacterium]|nr:tryptophan-rich sensory protein [Bacteroidaceae bacterium]
MKRSVSVLLWVLVCFAIGAVASYMQSDALVEWYPYLNNSSLTPPAWVFPVAWSVLYLLMGISVGLLWGVRSIYSTILYLLFGMQLVLNFLWSVFFFYFRSPVLGIIDLVMLDIFVLLYFVGAYVVKRASALLVIPYLLWLAFATYLNLYIAIYN